MKVKAANGFARILKAEGMLWVSCDPTNHVNNALGEERVSILMMGEERFTMAVPTASRASREYFAGVTDKGVCSVNHADNPPCSGGGVRGRHDSPGVRTSE